ncbi:Methionine aminopeptidase 1D, chloroplastic/mitochondrial [Linum perenne]
MNSLGENPNGGDGLSAEVTRPPEPTISAVLIVPEIPIAPLPSDLSSVPRKRPREEQPTPMGQESDLRRPASSLKTNGDRPSQHAGAGNKADGGRYNVSMRLSRALSGFTNLIFNSRIVPGISNVKRKRLRPGKLSPRRPVPDHILKPPYVNTGQSPGISTGIEVHDQKGIECMKASIVKASMHENFVWSVDSATNELSLFHCAFGVLFLLFFRAVAMFSSCQKEHVGCSSTRTFSKTSMSSRCSCTHEWS